MTSKTLLKLKNRKDVADVTDERSTGDGYWVYLDFGYCWQSQQNHVIHEYNIKDILKSLKYIKPCNCSECMKYKKEI